jgi:RNA polymerase-binding protein DksA
MEKKKEEHFERLLKDLLVQHIEKRRGLEESKDNLNEYAIEMEERAANEQMAIGLETMDDQAGGMIASIENALYRLREGLYDTCESCGGPIAVRRLEAVPWTSLCIDCISELERQQKMTKP